MKRLIITILCLLLATMAVAQEKKLLADFYTVLGRFQPYAGITLGGGAMTTLLMMEEPALP